MIEVIATLYHPTSRKLIAAKKIQFAEHDAARLSLMWAIRGDNGIGYSETVCRDLPIGDRSPDPSSGVSTTVAKVDDWVA